MVNDILDTIGSLIDMDLPNVSELVNFHCAGVVAGIAVDPDEHPLDRMDAINLLGDFDPSHIASGGEFVFLFQC